MHDLSVGIIKKRRFVDMHTTHSTCRIEGRPMKGVIPQSTTGGQRGQTLQNHQNS